MGLLDRLFSWNDPKLPEHVPAVPYAGGLPANAVQAYATIDLLNDVGFPEFFLGGTNFAGAAVNRRTVMRNTAVKRSVNLISNVMGMLPCQLLQDAGEGDDKKAKEHPLYEILSTAPNSRQDAFQFRKLMQRWLLIDGNAYALILRGRNGIVGLLPQHPSNVRVELRDNGTVVYHIRKKAGGERTYQAEDVFHLYADSDDGVCGISLVDEASEALGVSLQADRAAARLFKQGALIRDVLMKEGVLSEPAIARLKAQLQDEFGGSENAAKTLVLEEGLKYESVSVNAKDSQHLETRKHQIEEVGRIFGMPRPFLFLDDTSWGSGIEQLGIFFVTYTLAPWLKAWESAISRLLLTPAERRAGYYPKFNERALLRGSMKDQAEFFAKMMGSGGSPQILEQNEARGLMDFAPHPDGSGLSKGATNGGAEDGATGQNQA